MGFKLRLDDPYDHMPNVYPKNRYRFKLFLRNGHLKPFSENTVIENDSI